MTSIITSNISFASAQTVQNPAPVHPHKDMPSTAQAAQQQLAQLSRIVAENNLKTADSRKRGVIRPDQRVNGGFAPEMRPNEESPKIKSDSRTTRKRLGKNLDVAV